MNRFRFLSIALLGSLALAQGGCQKRTGAVSTLPRKKIVPSDPTVTVTTVKSANIQRRLELTGNLLPRMRTLIVTEVDGLIQSFPLSKQSITYALDGPPASKKLRLGLGQRVKKGEILVTLDPTDCELALAQAKSQLVSAKARRAALVAWKRPEEVEIMRATLLEAGINRESAKTEYDRAVKLKASNTTTNQELDAKQRQYKVSKARFANIQAQYNMVRAGPRSQDLAVSNATVASAQAMVNIAQKRLEKTKILAPYDGAITNVYVDLGDRVTALPRVQIMEFMALNVMSAQVGVPEKYAGKIKIGQLVSVVTAGSDEPVPGVVVRINQRVEPQSRSFRVRCAIDNRQGLFKAGQSTRVQFTIAASKSKVAIPKAALTFREGQPSVFVLNQKIVTLRAVRPGLSDGQFIEILEGLKANETIVTHDPAILADGMTVQLKSEDGSQ
jgi:multidrug efflux pump subunit AcrA (membrane-fusion protein)